MNGLIVNRKKFWSLYHEEFDDHGAVYQPAVDGLNFFLDRFETETRLDFIPQFAYVLATAFHESGKRILYKGEKVFVRFQPVREAKAAPSSEIWIRYQSKYWHTGFYGRGYVQATWEENYRKLGRLLNVGELFVENPDLLLEPLWAYEALVAGMVFGIYRRDEKGKRATLDRYLPNETATQAELTAARNIINGDIRKNGAHIAVIAGKFDRILRGSLVSAQNISSIFAAVSPAEDAAAAAAAAAVVPTVATSVNDHHSANPDYAERDSAAVGHPSVNLPAQQQQQQQQQQHHHHHHPQFQTPAVYSDGQINQNEPPSPVAAATGDSPDAAPRWFLSVEDLKPFVKNWIGKIWKAFGGANIAQMPALSGIGAYAGFGGRYWWVGIAAALLVFLLTLLAAAAVTAVLLIVLFWNRIEQVVYRWVVARSKMDPNSYNLGLKIEKKF